MTQIDVVLAIAANEVGTHDDGNNRVKYNKDYYGRDVAGENYLWCCVFVWWVFMKAGLSRLFFGGKKTASCTTLRDSYKRLKVTEARRGDIVFYNFSKKNSKAEHTGIIKSVNFDNKTINTFEGNTWIGNDSNGGQVMERIRPFSQVQCVVRPAYDDAETTPDPKPEVIIYTVKAGDNLTKIAKAYGTTIDKLVADNAIINKDLIRVGQKITINK